MLNYIDKMADALVDVLKYSNSTVEWVEAGDLKKDDGVLAKWFYPALRNGENSEITAILQYTQQAGAFDAIGELILGIALVEMKHLATIRDIVIALGGELPQPYDSRKVEIGTTVSEALMLGIHGEIAAIELYLSIIDRLTIESESTQIARQLLHKLVADESLHLKLINDKAVELIGDEYATMVHPYRGKLKFYTMQYS